MSGAKPTLSRNRAVKYIKHWLKIITKSHVHVTITWMGPASVCLSFTPISLNIDRYSAKFRTIKTTTYGKYHCTGDAKN